MITTWDKFHSDVLMDVPDCAAPVIDRALLRASQEFFDSTRIWRAVLDPIVITPNVILHELSLERGTEIVRIERATLSGREIDIVAAGDLPTDWMTAKGLRRSVHTIDRRNVYVTPALEAAGSALSLEVTLRPSDASTGIESHLHSQYGYFIAYGAKASLLMQPEKPYSNPSLAIFHEAKFKDAIAAFSIRAERGYSSHRRRLSGKFF
jgi:hypothetical protein